MSNNYDIHERIFNFIVKVITFLDKIPKNTSNIIFINQLTRSVTSMGANDQEADGALTRKDFLHGFTLVRKESKETVFWLRLIDQLNSPFNKEITPLIAEGKEIVAVVSKIIINTSRNKKA